MQDWPVPLQDVNDELLKCGVCDGYLGLVAQVLSMYSFLPACENSQSPCIWHFFHMVSHRIGLHGR